MSSDASGECPRGFACFADRVCIPTICTVRNDTCPLGFACADNRCRLVTGDGGGGAGRFDGGDAAGNDLGVVPPPLDGPDAAASPDAGAGLPDSPPRPDLATAEVGGGN